MYIRVGPHYLYAHLENAAYVLDLRVKFSSASQTSPGDVAWRERVLDLERDLTYLRMKYDEEQISK
jgi:hypothetical protein